jgi:hypothetical protein
MTIDNSHMVHLRGLRDLLVSKPACEEATKTIIKLADNWAWEWPTTRIFETTRHGIDFSESPWQGVLAKFHYFVGHQKNGLNEEQRRVILDIVFRIEFPDLGLPQKHIKQWGVPDSSGRLQKLAESLAAFCRNAKKQPNRGSYGLAIHQWNVDLDYLKKSIYDQRHWKSAFNYPVYKKALYPTMNKGQMKLPESCIPWLCENTSLSFSQIADAAGVSEYEVQAYADGQKKTGRMDPVFEGLLDQNEIERCSADSNAVLRISPNRNLLTSGFVRIK